MSNPQCERIFMVDDPATRTTAKEEFYTEMDILITKSIERFGKEIHRTLMRNVMEKHKGDWKEVSKEDLREKLKEEVYELLVALKKDKPEYITLETTDVAAVCMFLYDNFGSKNL